MKTKELARFKRLISETLWLYNHQSWLMRIGGSYITDKLDIIVTTFKEVSRMSIEDYGDFDKRKKIEEFTITTESGLFVMKITPQRPGSKKLKRYIAEVDEDNNRFIHENRATIKVGFKNENN